MKNTYEMISRCTMAINMCLASVTNDSAVYTAWTLFMSEASEPSPPA